MKEDWVSYLISWLLYDQPQAAQMVGYTNDQEHWKDYAVVIVPCGHLGKDWVCPTMEPPRIEANIIYTDIVYAAAFFTSRAEELIHPQRDAHGRFLAQYSMLGQHNRLLIPLLDEYARTLTKTLMRVCEEQHIDCPVSLPQPGYRHIYLSHDIDSLNQYRHLRGAVGGLIRGEGKRIWAAWKNIHEDTAYQGIETLVRLDEQCAASPQAEPIYFIKYTHGKGYDYPQYSHHSKAYQQLMPLLKQHHALLGVHSSYYGPGTSYPYSHHRSHYLRCSISDMAQLVNAGIRDDYTMMFADQCGFRLQTSRSVRWINPQTMELTPLTLHPLMIMDTTLASEQYMHLSEDEAYFYCEEMMEKVRQNHGDLCILWHNTTPNHNAYHWTLYSKLISLIH